MKYPQLGFLPSELQSEVPRGAGSANAFLCGRAVAVRAALSGGSGARGVSRLGSYTVTLACAEAAPGRSSRSTCRTRATAAADAGVDDDDVDLDISIDVEAGETGLPLPPPSAAVNVVFLNAPPLPPNVHGRLVRVGPVSLRDRNERLDSSPAEVTAFARALCVNATRVVPLEDGATSALLAELRAAKEAELRPFSFCPNFRALLACHGGGAVNVVARVVEVLASSPSEVRLLVQDCTAAAEVVVTAPALDALDAIRQPPSAGDVIVLLDVIGQLALEFEGGEGRATLVLKTQSSSRVMLGSRSREIADSLAAARPRPRTLSHASLLRILPAASVVASAEGNVTLWVHGTVTDVRSSFAGCDGFVRTRCKVDYRHLQFEELADPSAGKVCRTCAPASELDDGAAAAAVADTTFDVMTACAEADELWFKWSTKAVAAAMGVASAREFEVAVPVAEERRRRVGDVLLARPWAMRVWCKEGATGMLLVMEAMALGAPGGSARAASVALGDHAGKRRKKNDGEYLEEIAFI